MITSNIEHIEAIENHVTQINARIELIRPVNNSQLRFKEQALKDMADFQIKTLHEMRKEFEGD